MKKNQADYMSESQTLAGPPNSLYKPLPDLYFNLVVWKT
jgi:hypothetical protein